MTMKQLYSEVTGDAEAHQRRIDAQLRKLDARRQRMLRARVEGHSLRQIGTAEHISVGSVQSAINGALHTINKRIHNAPRYSVSRKRGDHAAAAVEAATPPAGTTPSQPTGPRQRRRALGLPTV